MLRFPFEDDELWSTVTSSLQGEFDFGVAVQLIGNGTSEEPVTRSLNACWAAGADGLDTESRQLLSICASFIQRGPELFSNSAKLLLLQGNAEKVSFTREQCCSILCMGLFACFRRAGHLGALERSEQLYFPHFEFARVVGGLVQPLKCILHYVERVNSMSPEQLSECVSFQRMKLHEAPDWSRSDVPVCSAQCTDRPIEMCHEAEFHADFANKMLGGGVLGGGNVQEEILFVIKPECIVGLLICYVMADDEGILIENPIMTSRYTGYGGRWRYAGDFEEVVANPTIVAIDACRNDRGGGQFGQELFHRDLNKVFASLGTARGATFATGNWGCGVFGGDIHLKFFQQLLACSQAGASLIYAPFGDKAAQEAISAFIPLLEQFKPSVGQLYGMFQRLSGEFIAKRTLLSLLAAEIKKLDPN